MRNDGQAVQESQNMEERRALSDEDVLRRANAAVQIALEKHRAMDVPSVVYDRKEQMIYQIHPDGTRIPVAKKSREGRYGEWGKAKA